MPRRLFNWTAEDTIRFLKQRGFQQDHSKGSHLFYIGHHGGKPRQVSVQFHGSAALKPRTLKSIIRQSGIPQREWLESE